MASLSQPCFCAFRYSRSRTQSSIRLCAVLVVAAGIGIGLLASWAASRFVGPLLFQVSATDPAIYALVGVTLLLVAALAGSLPAWRATRVDPREALQAD